MKTYNKLGLGLVLPLLVLTALGLFGPKKALAASPISSSSASLAGVSFKFADRANIQATFPGGTTATFTDSNPLDSTYNYVPADSSQFCSVVLIKQGIDLNNGRRDIPFGQSEANPVKARAVINLNVPTAPGAATTKCTPTPADVHVGNPSNAASVYLVATNGGLSDVNNKTPMTLVANTQNSLYAVDPTNASNCFGGTVAYLTGNLFNTGGKLANVYFLKAGGVGRPASENIDIGKHFSGSNCAIVGESDNVGVSGNPGTVDKGQACTGGADCDAQTRTCNRTGGDCINDNGPSPSCESNSSSHTMAWIICPTLGLLDSAAGGFNGFIEDQLCFNTGSSSTGGVNCPGQNNLTIPVHQAWGVFRLIATALLVIIMLVMVISQAIGGGPFDAYTIRKTLPKLVAAAILIQLSWVILKWGIDLSNDLGKGIADLMFAPFGGEGKMDIAKMVGYDVHVATGGGTAEGAFAFFGVLAALGLAIANIPGLLMLAFFTIIALATAFFVLVLRKILIILLVILAPIAFVLWILPGTESYWKMWRENFSKVLLMFPLIMGLLAAGRIFAYISSGSPGGVTFAPHLAVAHLGGLPVPYVANVTGFADLAIVVFAFFGPYLLLPKTFQWGGSLMRGAVRNVENSNARRELMKKGQEGTKGIGDRVQGYAGYKYNPKAKGVRGLTGRGVARLATGHYNPVSKRSRQLAIREGDQYSSDRNEEAAAYSGRIYNKALTEGYQARNKDGSLKFNANGSPEMLTGVAAAKQALVDLSQNKNERVAKGAIKQLIDTSSWVEIQKSYAANGKRAFEDNKNWNKTLAQDPELYPKVLRSRADAAPHILESQISNDWSDAQRFAKTITSYMDNENFASQSQGFWEDAARLSEDPEHGAEVREALRARFHAIHQAGPTVRQQMLGHLAGGEIQTYVDKVLGPGASVVDYMEERGGPGGGGAANIATYRATIPAASTLSDPAIRAQYKTNLLDNSGRTVSILGQGLANNVMPLSERTEHIKVMQELRSSASGSPESTAAYNRSVDVIQEAYNNRVRATVQDATAAGRSPEDIATIQKTAQEAAAAYMSSFPKIDIGAARASNTAPEDPSTLIIQRAYTPRGDRNDDNPSNPSA